MRLNVACPASPQTAWEVDSVTANLEREDLHAAQHAGLAFGNSDVVDQSRLLQEVCGDRSDLDR
jgi:hypothetical protein